MDLQHLGRTATEEEKQQIYELKTHYFERFEPSGKIDFAHDLLTKVQTQGLEIFVVTGSGQVSLLDSLETSFPGIFNPKKMVTAFDVVHGKPHPEPYLKALAKSGLQPWETLVVENAPLGVESAVAAGLFTIAVNTGPLNSQVLYDSGAHLVFDDGMKELLSDWDKIMMHYQCIQPTNY